MESPPKISVVIPIYGNLGDLPRLLAALRAQTLRPHEILLIDSSPRPLAELPPGEEIRHIKNPNDVALSWDYNLGLEHSTGEYHLHMQQDCLPGDARALERLYAHLCHPGRVAAVALVTLPEEVYACYNFWGKVMMARWVGRVRQGISGKFDLIRKDVLRKIGGYDTRNFSFAGEDMDLYLRLSAEGEVLVAPDVEVIHLHLQTGRPTWVHLFKKHYQLAQSFGALVRRWGPGLRRVPYVSHVTHHLAKYLYPLVLLLPFFPLEVGLTIGVVSQLTNLESWRVRDWHTPLLLLVNPLLFLVGFAGTITGLVTGRQEYSVNK